MAVRYYDSDTDGQLDGDATYDGTHYYLQDANFNVTAVVAVVDSTTTVLERYHYTPYGEVTTYDANWANSSTHSRINNPYLYTARRLDAKTGLYHYRTRPYHAQLGRFLGRDWKLYGGGDVNLYNYVGNGPLSGLDPWGLAPRRDESFGERLGNGIGNAWHASWRWFGRTTGLTGDTTPYDEYALESRKRQRFGLQKHLPTGEDIGLDGRDDAHKARDARLDAKIDTELSQTPSGCDTLCEEEQAKVWRQFWADNILFTYVPFYSDTRDIYEAFVGMDMVTKRRFSPTEHNATLIAVFIPVGSRKSLDHADDALDAARRHLMEEGCPSGGRRTCEAAELPFRDSTGKVHGNLPHPKDLGNYESDELRRLQNELRHSVRERIRKTVEKGRDRAHGQRQGAEQDLIEAIEKHLGGS